MTRPNYAGNTDIARRLLNGGKFHALHVGDSISTHLGLGLQRCLRAPKLTGFNSSQSFGAGTDNWGIPYSGTGGGGNPGYAISPQGGDADGYFRITLNGDTTGTASGTGPNTVIPFSTYAPSKVQSRQRFRTGAWLHDAQSRSATVTLKSFIRREATGQDGFFRLARYTDPYTIADDSATVTASGSGQVELHSLAITTIADTPGYERWGWLMNEDAATTAGKTIAVSRDYYVTTGEVGFEYGNLAVSGMSLPQWAAADGVWSDAYLSAHLNFYDVTDVFVLLGQNGPNAATYVADCLSLMTRLRGLKAGLSFVFFTPYETVVGNYNVGGTVFNDIAELIGDIADADPLGQTLVVNLYDRMGPREINFVQTASDNNAYDNFAYVDGAHPSDPGRARIPGEMNAALEVAAGTATIPDYTTLLNNLSQRVGAGSGDGDTAVNHDTGGTDNLAAKTSGGTGIDNATVRAYLKADYDAGAFTVRASAVTDVNGRWVAPMYLDTGNTYTFTFEKQGAYGTAVREQAV
jgi:hypothetical protein